ncbi:protein kinase, partial [Bifidobacterium pullorum subsp. saeculare]|uniref:protein kinase domain-containing protein n=1 Tax=Bifidobacterium pullorum TaxID=78448 RepID=UPI0019575EF0
GKTLEERYRLDAQIGTGGFGNVYRATHVRLKRQVAVKVLHAQHATGAGAARFEREAQALAAMSHPNVVEVVDYGVADGTPYIVME